MAKSGIKRLVVSMLGDGRWHTTGELAAAAAATFPSIANIPVNNAIVQIRSTPPRGTRLESKRIGKHKQYRLLRVDPTALTERVIPLLHELDRCSRAEMPRELPCLVRKLTEQIRGILAQAVAEANGQPHSVATETTASPCR